MIPTNIEPRQLGIVLQTLVVDLLVVLPLLLIRVRPDGVLCARIGYIARQHEHGRLDGGQNVGAKVLQIAHSLGIEVDAKVRIGHVNEPKQIVNLAIECLCVAIVLYHSLIDHKAIVVIIASIQLVDNQGDENGQCSE